MEGAQDCLPEADKQGHESDVPQTPGARCVYIIQKLLFDTKELNLVSLQDQIFVSGYSIDNDLKRIRKMLEPYSNLKLVRNKECISLKGDEASKRRFYRDLLVAEVQENFLNMNLLAGLYKSFDLLAVKDIFVDVLEEYCLLYTSGRCRFQSPFRAHGKKAFRQPFLQDTKTITENISILQIRTADPLPG